MKKWFLSNVELQTGIPSLYVEFNFWVQCCEFIFRMFPSFINLFPVFSFYDKINFFYNWSCRQEPSFWCGMVIFAWSSSSGLHQHFTIQLYTTWCKHSFSYVYETSLTKICDRQNLRTLDKARYRIDPHLKMCSQKDK